MLGYYMFMKGFEKGEVSLVAPVSGSYSIITVILAVVFLKEPLSVVRWAGVFLMMGGVFLTSIDIFNLGSIKSQKGIREAFWAMGGFGLSFFVLGFVSKQVNIVNLFIFASLSQALFFTGLALMKKGRVAKGDINLKVFLVFILHSLIVNLGWFAYILGINKDLVSLVTPVSSLFPGITVFLALVFYKEKLVTNQTLGIIGILAGVFLISR